MKSSNPCEDILCARSPPRVYSASAAMAFFSSSEKGTKGKTVVTRDKREACEPREPDERKGDLKKMRAYSKTG